MKGDYMSQDNSDLDQVAGQEVPEVENRSEQEKPESPMPSEEELTPARESEVEDSLPEDANERTREQFEKLKESNRKLKEQLEAKEKASTYGESAFDALYGRNQPTVNAEDFEHLSQQQVNAVVDDFVDVEGNVDIASLNKALKDANERASRAEKLAQSVATQTRANDEARQVAEAHAKHSWLDPSNSQFDETGYNLVVDRLTRYYAQGVNKPLAVVADEISQFYKPQGNPTQAKANAVDEYKKAQAQKAQASSVTAGKGQPRQEVTPSAELRERSLSGDLNALTERINMATAN